jgi:hypothetical protein
MKDLFAQIAALPPKRRELLLRELQKKKASRDKPGSSHLPSVSPEGEMSASYPTSLSQQWFLFLYDLSPGNFLYNMPYAVRLKGEIDVDALKRSIDEIVRRHEALRTTFPIVGGKRAQVIAASLDLGWPMIDVRGLPPSEREAEARRVATEEARRPFDIEQGPLIRAGLLHLAEDEYLLLLTIHHSNSDGWSMGVFTRELIALYEAFSKGLPSPLPRLAVQYKDFALWQRQWMQGEVLEEHLSYWKRQLDGAPACLNLPFDRPRPAVRTFWGESQSLVLSKELTEELKRLGVQENATLFMVLLAAFNALLYQYTNQDDVVVITHVAGRNRPEFEVLIGYFINNLVMRSDLSGEPTFRELLTRVRRVALEAYEHQELPVIKLVDALEPDLSLSLKTQVMFLLQNIPKKAFEFPNLTLASLNVRKGTVNRDLVFIVSERKDGLAGTISYSVDLFDAPTIQQMLQSFATLLYRIVADPDKRISDFAIREASTVS